MTAIHWVACDPRTGSVIESLPGLKVTSTIPRIIGKGGEVTGSLPVTDRLPARWGLATEPDRVLFVAHYDDDPQTILWAGVAQTVGYGSGPTVDFKAVPLEDWLDNRFMPTITYRQQDQAAIMRDIVSADVLAWVHGTDDTTMTGVKRDRVYSQDDDKSRLSAAQDLMSVIDGCEFTIRWEWDQGRLLCVPTVAQRIGRPAPAGGPTFVLGRVAWQLTRDYSAGKGATIVTGIATREGDQRVAVTRIDQTLIDAGYLPTEYRWQPDTGSVDASVIDGYVQARLADIRLGTTTLTVTAHVDDLILDKDVVAVGDDIGVDLANPDLPDPDHPDRPFMRNLVARMVGVTAQPSGQSGQITSIMPILQGLGGDDA